MTPAQIRQLIIENDTLADELRDKAAACIKAADAHDAESKLLWAMLPAAEEREAAKDTKELLQRQPVKSRVNAKKMHAQHKLAISEGQAKRDKRFKEAIRNAKPGYTQAGLAGALGMKASLLSMCRSGERAMFLSRAKRCEELTGWPADKAHWPGGIIDDA